MRDGMRKTERGQTHAGGVSLQRLRDTGDGDEERDEEDGREAGRTQEVSRYGG